MKRLSISQQFLLFWIAIIAGMFVGSRYSLSLNIVGFITIVWGLVYLSGQDPKTEVLSLSTLGIGLGLIIWQLTSGETWLRISWISSLGDQLIKFRDIIVDRFFMNLPEPHGSLLSGIIFGNRLKLDQEMINQFRIVGISHIIAVSGYNLSVMTSNIQSAFRPVIGKNAGYLALGAIVVFVLISGAPASILRAAVMASLVILAQFVGRPVRPINLIIITAGVLAIFEPKIIFQIGFQLSVAATYGVMRLSPLVKYTMRNIRLPKSLKDIFAETISAIVLTAPILIYSFGQLSVVSPLTNILILPLIPLLMGFGLLATVGVLISVKLGGLLTLLTWPILQWIIWVTDKFSRLNWALVRFDLPIWGLIMILVVIVAGTEQLQMFAQKKPDIAEKIINSSPTKI